eukprot:TRINITY_DN1089_c0_g1_i1.p1 TRINITY_DN1089_c0_g1~~TRINITY_DN1089_c0_g1_i1.p1  ORF type:complete len:360 (-),score=49.11 TRINITY_DN1089_c0_g1_i1:63-1142(-)
MMQRGIVALFIAALCAIFTMAPMTTSGSMVRAPLASAEEIPLVSVIIPTHDRPEFLAQALRQIKSQDYPNIEVVVVDDSEKPLVISADEMSIKVIRLADRKSIGEKRNLGAANANGKVIVHWDDDDYFRSHRITSQVTPILKGDVHMTVLEHHFYFVATTSTFYRIQRSVSWGPHFGTFAYSRSVFEAGVRYPDTSLAEDYSFAELALNQGYTIQVLGNTDGKHVYVRHENTWKFDLEEYGAQITQVDRPGFISDDDFAFLRSIKPATSHSLPPNHFISEATQWNREELHSMGKDSPKYPHYGPKYNDNGLSTGAKIGIGVGVAGGVVLIVVVGIAAYFLFQWQKRRHDGGYARLNTDI